MMKTTGRSPILNWLTTLSVMVSLCAGLLVTGKTGATPRREGAQGRKVSSGLQRGRGVNSDGGRVKVVLQLKDRASGQLDALLNRYGAQARREFRNLNSVTVELPASAVDELAAIDEVDFVSEDREVRSFGHLSMTTGADAMRLQTTSTGTPYVLDGSGIGVAVLDSGIDNNHESFTNAGGTASRIVVNRDFTGEGRTDDPYGHGTHVASLAAGNGRIKTGKYLGIAPEARILNLRVLKANGTGNVSNVLSALDWVMANRTTYNIRVVNISLGMPAIDSYRDDPLCKAVRRLVDAGIVVVAAAGNSGRDGNNNKVYGRIHSPGNEPSAITVGASNTDDTTDRADDKVTTYSSRGPTRSYSTDESGVKHYDNLIKPDIVAPGNKIVGAEARDNYLIRQNPLLDVLGLGGPTKRMMVLNGSSMATPTAAGAAALMLEVNPRLTPNMIKAILMYTAQQLAGYNMFEQGAGQLNISGAVRLAKLVRTDLTPSTPVGAPLLTTATPPTPYTTIPYLTNSLSLATTSFTWSQGLILHHTYATGSPLISSYQRIYATGVLFGDGIIYGDGRILGDPTMMSSGIIYGDNILTSLGLTMNDGSIFTSSSVLFGDGVILGEGMILGDGLLIGDGVMISDSVLTGDAILQAYSALTNGDTVSSRTGE